MPGKLKVKIVAGRHLPVMDRASDLTDAFVEVCGEGREREREGGREGRPRRLAPRARAPAAGPARLRHLPGPVAAPPTPGGTEGPTAAALGCQVPPRSGTLPRRAARDAAGRRCLQQPRPAAARFVPAGSGREVAGGPAPGRARWGNVPRRGAAEVAGSTLSPRPRGCF